MYLHRLQVYNFKGKDKADYAFPAGAGTTVEGATKSPSIDMKHATKSMAIAFIYQKRSKCLFRLNVRSNSS